MIKIIIIVLFLTFKCLGNDNSFQWVNTIPKPWKINEKDIGNYLKQFHFRFPDFNQRLKAINLWRVGTPYGLYCLGEEGGIDNDPIIRIDSSDCTVHVLTTLAFAKSLTWNDARENMITIHYKPDSLLNHIPKYKNRWHFTSDRILNHDQTIDITRSLVDPSMTKKVTIELNKKENGDEFLDLNWSSKQDIVFIPSNYLDSTLLSRLPLVCGVSFVNKNYFKLGIAIAHEGYLIDQKNLVHASSEFGETVKINFLDYLKIDGKYRFDGVMFFALIDNK